MASETCAQASRNTQICLRWSFYREEISQPIGLELTLCRITVDLAAILSHRPMPHVFETDTEKSVDDPTAELVHICALVEGDYFKLVELTGCPYLGVNADVVWFEGVKRNLSIVTSLKKEGA